MFKDITITWPMVLFDLLIIMSIAPIWSCFIGANVGPIREIVLSYVINNQIHLSFKIPGNLIMWFTISVMNLHSNDKAALVFECRSSVTWDLYLEPTCTMVWLRRISYRARTSEPRAMLLDVGSLLVTVSHFYKVSFVCLLLCLCLIYWIACVHNLFDLLDCMRS